MKRLVVLGAIVLSACAVTPQARASSPVSTDLVKVGASGTSSGASSDRSSVLNPILNRFPLLQGPDSRHVCLISDGMNKSWCVYIPIP